MHEIINKNGGYSIGVYNPETKQKEKVYKMMHDDRIKYFAPADYNEGSELDKLVKTIIDKTYHNELLKNYHYRNREEYEQDESNFTEEQKTKNKLILSLEQSGSFKATHTIISELRKIVSWTQKEIDWLIDIANNNSQVLYILSDEDISRFYKEILKKKEMSDEKTEELKRILYGE